jgi:putative heme-binding domain-containing protein
MRSPEEAASIASEVLQQDRLRDKLDAAAMDVLEAWGSGSRKAKRSISAALDSLSAANREGMVAAFQAAVRTAEDLSQQPSLRARCVTVSMSAGETPDDLRGLFAETSPPEVRIAVLAPLLRSDPQWMRSYLEEHLTGMSLRLRHAALAACGSRPEDAIWLLDRIADGAIPKTIIDPEMAKRLRQHPNSEVASRAESLLRSDPDRAKVLAEYAAASESLGDPVVGRKLFAEHCSACHHIDGVGTNVGPDISDTRTKTAEALLVSILDPNAAIDSSFVQFQILTQDGRILDGLLIDETADAVTLQQKGGQRVMVPREDIDRMQAPGVSLMPEGFERTLDLQAMSHLLSYLKNWRYLKTSIPGTLPQ